MADGTFQRQFIAAIHARFPPLRARLRHTEKRMNLGRLLIVAGFALVALGVIVLLVSRFNIPLGRLPGDIVYRGRNSSFYFPWVTCLLISVLLTLILWLLNRRM